MTTDWPPPLSKQAETLLVVCISLLALAVRSVGHWYAPRGWREDELSNALVVSQHVLDGEVRLYYDDASGHEGLYHWLQAGSMAAFGPGVWGIRGVSILLGTLAVPAIYLLARRLFDWPTAALSALLLAFSFWSLMYSRSGQRHISVTVTTLLSFYCLWRAFPQAAGKDGEITPPPYKWRKHLSSFVLAGLFMGIGFYTYFASRGVPLIVLAWAIYLLILRRDLWRQTWRGLLITFGITLALAVPLIVTLQHQPGAEARVAELAKPIYDAQRGDFSTLARYALTTAAMFTHDGDDEVLYNVPHRPVFGPLGGALLWGGVVVALIRAFGAQRDPRMAFLLLWLAAGLVPGALSVPAASLGHTILTQPVAMMLPALALSTAASASRSSPWRPLTLAAAATLLIWEGTRGVYDYWFVWPNDSFNRVLHHSDLHEAARWLNAHGDTRNVAIGGFLNERWDQQVMKLDLEGEGWQVRAFNPNDAYLLIPGGGVAVLPEYLRQSWGAAQLGEPIPLEAPYALLRLNEPGELAEVPARACFDNGLCLITLVIEAEQGENMLTVLSGWRVERPLKLPPFPLLSKPPAPDEDDTPRLATFVQLLDGNGQRITGADGLGVDPYTLVPGDVFIQRSPIPLNEVPSGSYQLVIGLYNPSTGARHIDEITGRDIVRLGTWSAP